MVVFISELLNWQLVNSNWLIVELLIVRPISNISTGYRVLSGICIGIGGIGGIGIGIIGIIRGIGGIGNRQSAASAIGNRQSAIGNRKH
jgi:hypothetical protein